MTETRRGNGPGQPGQPGERDPKNYLSTWRARRWSFPTYPVGGVLCLYHYKIKCAIGKARQGDVIFSPPGGALLMPSDHCSDEATCCKACNTLL